MADQLSEEVNFAPELCDWCLLEKLFLYSFQFVIANDIALTGLAVMVMNALRQGQAFFG